MEKPSKRVELLKDQYSYAYKLNQRCILYEIKKDYKKAAKLYLELSSKVQFFINRFYDTYQLRYEGLPELERSIIDKLLDIEANANIKNDSIVKDGDSYHLMLSNRSVENISSYSAFNFTPKEKCTIQYQTQDPAKKIQYIKNNSNHKLKKIDFTHRKSKSSISTSSIITPEQLPSSIFRVTPKSTKVNDRSSVTIRESPVKIKEAEPEPFSIDEGTIRIPEEVLNAISINNSQLMVHSGKKISSPTSPKSPKITFAPKNNSSSTGRLEAYSKRLQSKAKPKEIEKDIPNTAKESASQGVSKQKLAGLSELELKIYNTMSDLQGVDVGSCKEVIKDMLVKDEAKINWDDMSGLDIIKKVLRVDSGTHSGKSNQSSSGILLFGPRGTGKYSIARCLSNQSTLFKFEATSLLSDYRADSEKVITALFYLAKDLSPSTIFINNIDLLIPKVASSGEYELLTKARIEFSRHWTNSTFKLENGQKQVRIIGSTDTPWLIDDIERKKFSQVFYTQLPEFSARMNHLYKILSSYPNTLSETEYFSLAQLTRGFSSADLIFLCKNAEMISLRELGESLYSTDLDVIRGITFKDLKKSAKGMKRNIDEIEAKRFKEWNNEFGTSIK